MATASLERFRAAQDSELDGFSRALSELRTTGKQSHWIWYIFPQLAGLGTSALAQRFGLAGVDEATAYFLDPSLRSRLVECTRAVASGLEAGRHLTRVMGSDIDALKLVSSLTLFEGIAARLGPEYQSFVELSKGVLARAEAQGYPRCRFTRRALEGGGVAR